MRAARSPSANEFSPITVLVLRGGPGPHKSAACSLSVVTFFVPRQKARTVLFSETAQSVQSVNMKSREPKAVGSYSFVSACIFEVQPAEEYNWFWPTSSARHMSTDSRSKGTQ